MTLAAGSPPLLKNLTTDKLGDGTNYVAAVYGNRVRPWSSGYRQRIRAEAANTVYGINHPGETSPRVIRLSGAGVANNATDTTFTYTIPAAALTAIAASYTAPVTAAFTTNLLLNASLVIYALKDQANKQFVKRYGTGVAAPAAVDALTPFFRILAGGASLVIVTGGITAGALYKDLPTGWVAELILPDMATVQTLKTFAAAGEDVAPITDFIAVAGGTSAAQTVALHRVYR